MWSKCCLGREIALPCVEERKDLTTIHRIIVSPRKDEFMGGGETGNKIVLSIDLFI